MDAETYSDWNATLDNLHRQMAEQRHEITAYQIAKDNLELRLQDADGGNMPLPAQVY